MRQMFTETYKYNSPDSEIVTAAGKLQKEFEVRFAKMNFQDRKPGKLVYCNISILDGGYLMFIFVVIYSLQRGVFYRYHRTK